MSPETMTDPRPPPVGSVAIGGGALGSVALGGEERALAERSIATLKTLAMDAVEKARSGHPGTPMALAPLAYALWTRVMSYSAAHPSWPDRDRFVLSCGHASMLLYGALHLSGYALTLEAIRAFRQWDSPAAGHPELGATEGIETTTGPLGQGLGNAVGMALAERMLAERFNRPGHVVVDHRTWVIASDGDLMEGVSAEAASLAGHLGLARLCVFYDDNRITIDGRTQLCFSEDVGARFRAYGWNVLYVPLDAPWSAYAEAAEQARGAECPTLVVCRTRIAPGAPTKEDSSEAHGAPLGEAEIRGAKRSLGWPEDAQFLVPPEVLTHMRAAGARGGARVSDWERRMVAYRAAFPAEAQELERALAGRLPAGWEAKLPTFAAGQKLATRQASGKTLNALAALIPELVGGSADLAGSNNTAIAGVSDVQRGRYGGRILHFGVREHAMGAVLNGMALHGGWRVFGGTFLIFSDYMKPAIRLAALMELPVIYVFTHDSIGVGEDGPTHQPIEQLAGLRAIPGLCLLRPADASETAEAWKVALERRGPTALVLTRQALPVFERAPSAPAALAPAAGLRRGGYVLRESAGARLTLLATGSEVELALAAADLLASRGAPARVISLPSWDLFSALSAAERAVVLGPGTTRVAIEAAASLGWERWVGEGGAFVTLDRFGACAPAARLFQELGFTAEHVAQTALAALAARAALGPASR